MNKISIFGSGFVGKAIYNGFSPNFQIKIYDKFKGGYNSLIETVDFSSVIFICVPTPMNDDGSQNLSAMEDAVETISSVAKSRKILVLKSTILPGTTRSLAEKYPKHDFIFNPEFLTERNADFDFINQSRVVIGGKTLDDNALEIIEKLYRIRFPHTPIHKCLFEEGELVKYICNCYFASKVSFMNEVYDICKAVNVDYNSLRKLFLGDFRIANSHTEVPGPDGCRGWGGKCLKPSAKVKVNSIITTLNELYNSIENRNKYYIESTDFNIKEKENKEIIGIIESYIEEEMYEFELENGSIFECTKEHLIPVLRNDKKILVEAQNIKNTDLFFIE